jgi:hypothetical protein
MVRKNFWIDVYNVIGAYERIGLDLKYALFAKRCICLFFNAPKRAESAKQLCTVPYIAH